MEQPNFAAFTGEDFKEYRKQAGLTQQQVADLIGLSRESVSKIERTKGNLLETVKVDIILKFWKVCSERIPAKRKSSLKDSLLLSFARLFKQ